MKIAIPVDKQDLEAKVASSFGRATYFLIYDQETKVTTYVENSALANPGGAGIKAAQIVVDNQVDALLTPQCGQNAAVLLNSAEIKLFKTLPVSIKDNLLAFFADELEVLTEIHAGFHGHGGE